MKNKLLFTIFCSMLCMPSMTLASTDWTPYVKSLQNSCDGEKLYDLVYQYNTTKQLPKSLQPSIVKITPINIFADSETKASFPADAYEINLKNATAFGYPLTKIRIAVPETEYFEFSMTFKNDKFMDLLPKFSLVSSTNYRQVAGTEKLWVEYTSWSESQNKFLLKKRQFVPYQNFNQDNFVENVSKKTDDEMDYAIYKTNKNGWSEINSMMNSSLIFNKKLNTITCIADG